jgi:hypothetical protein
VENYPTARPSPILTNPLQRKKRKMISLRGVPKLKEGDEEET